MSTNEIRLINAKNPYEFTDPEMGNLKIYKDDEYGTWILAYQIMEHFKTDENEIKYLVGKEGEDGWIIESVESDGGFAPQLLVSVMALDKIIKNTCCLDSNEYAFDDWVDKSLNKLPRSDYDDESHHINNEEIDEEYKRTVERNACYPKTISTSRYNYSSDTDPNMMRDQQYSPSFNTYSNSGVSKGMFETEEEYRRMQPQHSQTMAQARISNDTYTSSNPYTRSNGSFTTNSYANIIPGSSVAQQVPPPNGPIMGQQPITRSASSDTPTMVTYGQYVDPITGAPVFSDNPTQEIDKETYYDMEDVAAEYGYTLKQLCEIMYNLGAATGSFNRWTIDKDYIEKKYVVLNKQSSKSEVHFAWTKKGKQFIRNILAIRGVYPL